MHVHRSTGHGTISLHAHGEVAFVVVVELLLPPLLPPLLRPLQHVLDPGVRVGRLLVARGLLSPGSWACERTLQRAHSALLQSEEADVSLPLRRHMACCNARLVPCELAIDMLPSSCSQLPRRPHASRRRFLPWQARCDIAGKRWRCWRQVHSWAGNTQCCPSRRALRAAAAPQR